MKFRVAYNTDGAIVAYQEGGEDDQFQCPDGCLTLAFENPVRGMFNDQGTLLMTVDTVAKQLVLLDPIEIPRALSS